MTSANFIEIESEPILDAKIAPQGGTISCNFAIHAPKCDTNHLAEANHSRATSSTRRMLNMLKGQWLTQLLQDQQGTIALIFRLIRENSLVYWRRYALAFSLLGVTAATTAASAYILGRVINQAYVDRNFTGVAVLAGVIALLFTLKGLATYSSTVVLSQISNRIIAANQQRLFDKLMSESLEFFAARHSSDFINILTGGVNSVSQVLNLCINAIGRDLLSLIGLVIVMVWQDPIMSIFGLVIAPPAMFGLRKLVKRVREVASTQFGDSAQALETFQETVQGIRTVKAFTLEEQMRAKLAARIASVERMANKLARVTNRSSPLMETLGGLAISGTLIYAGYRVIETGAEPGQFFSFLTAFLLAYEPAKRLARLNIDLNSALIGVRMLFEIIDSPPTERDDRGKPAIKLTQARIEFRNVTFAYRQPYNVLNGMNFVAEPGEVTALVGPSGGGKSTILALLLRFYDVTSGAIAVDGQSLDDVSRHSLRDNIAYVGQDIFLFRDTIRANIAHGRPNATDDDIVAAAKAACAHDFIMAFPLGYGSPVGEHGAQLSGGQRQRIAIARALLKNAPIVLLDEPTASLDSESEQQVHRAFRHLCRNRTTIVIAHRLHTITNANKILVIENGCITESGGHGDLLDLAGRYANFFNIQHQSAETQPSLDVPA